MSFVVLFLKGLAMGAANVIPGVSGGTIAFVTGIYDRLITAISMCNLKALRMLFTGQFRTFSARIDLVFLIVIGLGIAASVFTLAKLLTYLFEHYPVLLWAFFFGLILASAVLVAKGVRKWGAVNVTLLILGAALAAALAFVKPAAENDSTLYLFLCGIVVICSMILPGLSGSFVLIVMGNYFLLLKLVDELDLPGLLPTFAGCVVGVIAFSHALKWLLNRFRDQTVSVLTGFVIGSLVLIWPWKTSTVVQDKVVGYNWQVPLIDSNFYLAVAMMISGFLLVWLIDRIGKRLAPERNQKLSNFQSSAPS